MPRPKTDGSTGSSRAERPVVERRVSDAAVAIGNQTACDAGEMAYQARALVQTTLPHRNPGTAIEYVRHNGHTTVTVLSPSKYGLPYGALPRIILLWANTRAVQQQNPVVELDYHVIGWLRQLGYRGHSGGERGNREMIKNQMKRLQCCSIIVDTEKGDTQCTAHLTPIDDGKLRLWWSEGEDSQGEPWKIVLHRKYYEELLKSPVPLDWRVIRALRQSPMALDLYAWLPHRYSYLEGATRIPWEALRKQFGCAHRDVRGFRDHVRRVLRHDISAICSGYRYDASDPRYLLLFASDPVVQPRRQGAI